MSLAQQRKAEKVLDKITKVDNKTWVLPSISDETKTHTVELKDKELECDCLGYTHTLNCYHVMAVQMLGKKEEEREIKFMTSEEQLVEEEVQTLPINFDEYDPANITIWDTYQPIGDEYEAVQDAIMQSDFPYLIESEKGQGKTLLVHTICKRNKIALVTQPLGTGTNERDLLGSKEINRDGTVFKLGLFPTAIEVANKYKHAVLYGDEGNAQDHEIQKQWNSICDGRKYIVANGKKYQLNDGCKLSIVWTINPVTYAGVNSMTEDLRSRFIGDVWSYPTPEDMKRIIDWKDLSEETVRDPFLTLVQDIYALRMKNEVDYAISIRDMVQFVKYLTTPSFSNEMRSIEQALKRVILIKYSDASERELVKIRCNDTFGVNL